MLHAITFEKLAKYRSSLRFGVKDGRPSEVFRPTTISKIDDRWPAPLPVRYRGSNLAKFTFLINCLIAQNRLLCIGSTNESSKTDQRLWVCLNAFWTRASSVEREQKWTLRFFFFKPSVVHVYQNKLHIGMYTDLAHGLHCTESSCIYRIYWMNRTCASKSSGVLVRRAKLFKSGDFDVLCQNVRDASVASEELNWTKTVEMMMLDWISDDENHTGTAVMLSELKSWTLVRWFGIVLIGELNCLLN